MPSETNLVEIDWMPDKSHPEPIYRQIVNYISRKISCGDWTIGSRRLSVSWRSFLA